MIEVDFVDEKPLAGTRKGKSESWVTATCRADRGSHVSRMGAAERPFDVFLRERRFRLDQRVTCPKIGSVVSKELTLLIVTTPLFGAERCLRCELPH